MTVMTRSYTVCSACDLNLLIFHSSIGSSCFGHPRLEKASSPSAAVIVRSVRRHFNEVILTYNRFYNKPQVLGNRVPKTLADQLAWILNSKLDL